MSAKNKRTIIPLDEFTDGVESLDVKEGQMSEVISNNEEVK